MTLQIIKSIDGKSEYVLLPVNVYNALRSEIEKALKKKYSNDEYAPFELAGVSPIDSITELNEIYKTIKIDSYFSKLNSFDGNISIRKYSDSNTTAA